MKLKSTPGLTSLEAIVQDYTAVWQAAAGRELRYYARLDSLEDVIEVAGLAEFPRGKRHNHQRQVRCDALKQARDRLLEANLRACTTFDELLERIDQVTADIFGYGELTVYDTALRIGAYLKLEPDKVYLHTGTRDGAKALGLDGKRKAINVEELPEAFRRLKVHEIEDVLCIYADQISKVNREHQKL